MNHHPREFWASRSACPAPLIITSIGCTTIIFPGENIPWPAAGQTLQGGCLSGNNIVQWRWPNYVRSGRGLDNFICWDSTGISAGIITGTPAPRPERTPGEIRGWLCPVRPLKRLASRQPPPVFGLRTTSTARTDLFHAGPFSGPFAPSPAGCKERAARERRPRLS